MTIIRVGVDIAKSVFHVHGADRQGKTGKMHEKPLYDGPRSALPIGAHVVI